MAYCWPATCGMGVENGMTVLMDRLPPPLARACPRTTLVGIPPETDSIRMRATKVGSTAVTSTATPCNVPLMPAVYDWASATGRPYSPALRSEGVVKDWSSRAVWGGAQVELWSKCTAAPVLSV